MGKCRRDFNLNAIDKEKWLRVEQVQGERIDRNYKFQKRMYSAT